MIREVFVPLLRLGSDSAALDAAAALAAWQPAQVSALVTIEHPIPIASEWGYFPIEVSQQQYEALRASAQEQAEQARAQLTRRGAPHDVRISEAVLLWSEETAALHARHADLSLLAVPDDAGHRGRLQDAFSGLLLHSGRPVLVVPAQGGLVLPPKKAVMAWLPTREAARAVHDALPLLASAAEIDLLMIDPQVAEGRHGEQPGADLARHLARHGLQVNVVALPRQGLSVGENLLRYCQQVGTDLLVMGGYGHSRWRQAMLGGTTLTVLHGLRQPVLFAH